VAEPDDVIAAEPWGEDRKLLELLGVRGASEFSSSSLAWVVNAYLIAYGGQLLLANLHRLGPLEGPAPAH